jgi:hypothetical protein
VGHEAVSQVAYLEPPQTSACNFLSLTVALAPMLAAPSPIRRDRPRRSCSMEMAWRGFDRLQFEGMMI